MLTASVSFSLIMYAHKNINSRSTFDYCNSVIIFRNRFLHLKIVNYKNNCFFSINGALLSPDNIKMQENFTSTIALVLFFVILTVILLLSWLFTSVYVYMFHIVTLKYVFLVIIELQDQSRTTDLHNFFHP